MLKLGAVLIALAAGGPAYAQSTRPLPNPAPQIPMPDSYNPNNPLNYPPPQEVPQQRGMNPNVSAPQGLTIMNLNNGQICQQQGNIIFCY